MTIQCEQCDDSLDDEKSGVLSVLGLSSAEGYECKGCGSGLCEPCYRTRQRELRGASHDVCPVCGEMLRHR